jgi:hypothetical protein
MAKNKDVVNAPSDKEILEGMKQTAPIANATVNDIDKLMSEYKTEIQVDTEAAQEFAKGKRGRKKGQKAGMTAEEATKDIIGEPVNIDSNPIITGGLLILLIDLVLPNIIAFANNKFSKTKKIKATDLQLSEDERKQLEPLAEQVAKEMSVKANPLTVLIVSLVGMYGMKLMMQKS